MKIALGQINVKPAQPEINLKSITNFVDRASKEKVDIIAFPEMAIPGYLLGDRWLSDDFCLEMMSYDEDIKKLSKDYNITIVYGNVFLSNTFTGKDGRKARFNSARIVSKGEYPERYTILNSINDILPKGCYV